MSTEKTVKITSRIYIACLVSLVGMMASNVQASLITPTSVSSSTATTDFWTADNLINDSGLTPAPGTLSSTHEGVVFLGSPNSWVTDACGFPCDYFDSEPTPVLIFDLGGTFNLSDVVVWNYALLIGDGIINGNQSKDITVDFSTTGTAGVFANAVDITLLGDLGPWEAQVISVGSVAANAVRFTITDNYFDTNIPDFGGDRVGLSEVKFMVVPEPGTLALFGLGLAGLGFARRKKA